MICIQQRTPGSDGERRIKTPKSTIPIDVADTVAKEPMKSSVFTRNRPEAFRRGFIAGKLGFDFLCCRCCSESTVSESSKGVVTPNGSTGRALFASEIWYYDRGLRNRRAQRSVVIRASVKGYRNNKSLIPEFGISENKNEMKQVRVAGGEAYGNRCTYERVYL